MPRAYVEATMSLGTILGVGYDPPDMGDPLMGLLLQYFTCQNKHRSVNRTPGQGYLIVRPISEYCFLLMSKAGASRTETPRLGQSNKSRPRCGVLLGLKLAALVCV